MKIYFDELNCDTTVKEINGINYIQVKSFKTICADILQLMDNADIDFDGSNFAKCFIEHDNELYCRLDLSIRIVAECVKCMDSEVTDILENLFTCLFYQKASAHSLKVLNEISEQIPF